MQNQLQIQAEEIIDKLNLFPILNNFGEAHLVGNVAFGTTVKPDIDFQIYSDENLLITAQNIEKALVDLGLTKTAARELKLSHNKALATGIYLENGQEWTIDVSVTTPDSNYVLDGYAFYKEYQDKFSKDKIETIIRLKKAFQKKNMLWNGMSYYVYRAVIDENAKDLRDIFDYLKENNINISRFRKGK